MTGLDRICSWART